MSVHRFNAAQQVLNAFGSQFPATQGRIIFCRPGTGSDGRDGSTPQKAVASLTEALSLATANQNDIVALMAESNTAGSTTDRSGPLDWNKDGVHLIGIGADPFLGQRARIAFASTYDTVTPLLTLSANGCRLQGLEIFMGVAGTTPIGALKVTGQRNVVRRCQISGIGNAANDIAGAYSVNVSGGAENIFEDCYIGLDTIVRSAAANCEILIDTAATRNKFVDCTIAAMIGHATNHPLVRLTGATAIDRWLHFKRCLFLNESVNYAFAQAGNFKLSADLTQGFIILEDCMTNPSDDLTAVKWDADDRNRIALMNAPTPAADTAGVARMV
jgi:hypothetical protein